MSEVRPSGFPKREEGARSVRPSAELVQGLGKARATQGGKYFKPGHFRARVNRCKWQKNRKGIEAFIAECEIIETNSDESPVGYKPAIYIGMDKDPAEGNLAEICRYMLASLAGTQGFRVSVDDDQFWADKLDEDTLWEIVGPEQSCAGVELIVDAEQIEVKASREAREMNPDLAPRYFTKLTYEIPPDVLEGATEPYPE